MAQTYQWLSNSDSTQPLISRFSPPNGFERQPAGQFGEWLRNLPLKPGNPRVFLFDGRPKPNQLAHLAVVNIDIGRSDLQQCADAVLRLRAEYLFTKNRKGDIAFNFTSGDRSRYSEWMKGVRPVIRGNSVSWRQSARADSSYRGFKSYLRNLFTYAGTYSLQKELEPVASLSDLKIGDVFIQGGFPGHAVLVADLVINPDTGQKAYLLLQSFMPAQNIQVLKNPASSSTQSPWYLIGDSGMEISTPEWTFQARDLYRFPN